MSRWVHLGCLLIAGSAFAQSGPLKPGPAPVLGEPFTAERVVTSYQQLANGTRIEHRTSSLEARDSSGRTWSKSELRQDPLHPRPAQYRVRIYDPNTLTEASWCTCGKVVTLVHFAEPKPLPPIHAAPREGMDVYLGPSPSARLKYHAEDLGPQILQGVMTQGSKAVRILPAGADGNNHELTTTVYSWYSQELHLAISTIIDDPVAGLRKLEFTNLKRVEPDPAIFQLPPGYIMRGPQ